MDDNKIVRIAAYGFIGVVVAPVVIGVAFQGIGLVANGINKIAYNMKIKKGLKDGSIVECDGEYYEVKNEDV